MKGLQMLLKALGLELDANTLAMIQALIPQLPAKINEASAAINSALQNFDARLRAIESAQQALGLLIVKQGQKTDYIPQIEEMLKEVLNGHTGRTSDTPGPTDAGASGGDSGGTGTGRRRRSE